MVSFIVMWERAESRTPDGCELIRTPRSMSYSSWPRITLNKPDESNTYKHAVCSQDVNIQEPSQHRISNSNVISLPEGTRRGIVLGEGKR